MAMLLENYKKVQENIRKACVRSGRDPSDITLLAVSKTHPAEMIQEIYEQGQLDFGENKAQELKEKYGILPKDIRWHMIGHMQRNKVKYIIDKVCMIHSMDSVSLAETISREASKYNICMPVLIEVNVAGEESKFGIHVEETLPFIQKISVIPNISVQGLMTIAPDVVDPEENRPVFKRLRELSVDIKNKNIDNVFMNVLSMGMTNDYEIAVEEGSTVVRVGSGIFGARDYSKMI